MALQGREPAAKVVVEFKNKQPLDLLDLTASLGAFGEEYRRHAANEFPEGVNARLHIGQIRSGSVIAELVPILSTVDWAQAHTDFVTPFAAQFGELLNLLRAFPPMARDENKSSVKAAKTFVAPIARDPGSEVHVYAQAGSHVTTNVFNIGSNSARTIRRHADIILAGMPEEITFTSEPMVLFQMRDGHGDRGDFAFIDRFSADPVKLRWGSDEVKEAVLGRPENLFDLIYFVSGTVQTAAGRVVAFKIRRLDEVAHKPLEERHH